MIMFRNVGIVIEFGDKSLKASLPEYVTLGSIVPVGVFPDREFHSVLSCDDCGNLSKEVIDVLGRPAHEGLEYLSEDDAMKILTLIEQLPRRLDTWTGYAIYSMFSYLGFVSATIWWAITQMRAGKNISLYLACCDGWNKL